MGIAGLALGCAALLVYMFSTLPMLRLVNVVTIPVAIAGIVISALAIGIGASVALATIGLLMSIFALVLGWNTLMGQRPVQPGPV